MSQGRERGWAPFLHHLPHGVFAQRVPGQALSCPDGQSAPSPRWGMGTPGLARVEEGQVALREAGPWACPPVGRHWCLVGPWTWVSVWWPETVPQVSDGLCVPCSLNLLLMDVGRMWVHFHLPGSCLYPGRLGYTPATGGAGTPQTRGVRAAPEPRQEMPQLGSLPS